MKILLTHPYCWPYVRRGSERSIETHFHHLHGSGHDVTLLSTKPRSGDLAAADGRTRRLQNAWWTPPLAFARIQPEHMFGVSAWWEMQTIEADAVHSFFYTDSLAASAARRRKRWRTILQLNGIAIPGVSCRRFPPEAWLLRKAIDLADEFVVCSAFIAAQAKLHFGREPRVVAPPIEMQAWPLGSDPREGPPTVLAVGDFNVRRKGIRVLLEAFSLFHAAHPDAILNISGRLATETVQPILDGMTGKAREAVRLLGLGQPGDLPALYRQANMLVLPAMSEPSGMVMLEALASGTPVVAARHGGLPEYLSPEVSVMFDPQSEGEETLNAEGLREAMESALVLSRAPGIRPTCRRHAEKYSAEAMGPVWERIYAG